MTLSEDFLTAKEHLILNATEWNHAVRYPNEAVLEFSTRSENEWSVKVVVVYIKPLMHDEIFDLNISRHSQMCRWVPVCVTIPPGAAVVRCARASRTKIASVFLKQLCLEFLTLFKPTSSLSFSLCLSVCLPACLSVCISVCLPACLSVCLAGCLSVCLTI